MPDGTRELLEQIRIAVDTQQRQELEAALRERLYEQVDAETESLRERIERMRADAPAAVERRLERLLAPSERKRPGSEKSRPRRGRP